MGVIFLVLVTALIGGAFLGPRVGVKAVRSAPEWRKMTPSLQHQRATSRLWKKLVFRKLFTLGENGALGFGDAPKVKLDPLGNLYVVDYRRFSIKKYDPTGRLLGVYGNGKGGQPGSFDSITDVGASPDGDVYVADVVRGTVTMFSSQARLLNTFKPQIPIYRLVSIEPDNTVVMFPPGRDSLFGVITRDGRLVSKFGSFLENPLDGIVLDGVTARAGGSRFVYAPFFLGWLAVFSDSGELKVLAETMNRPAIPAVNHGADGSVWIDQDVQISTQSLSVVGDQIFLLSGTPSGSRTSSVVDVYQLSDGQYQYSFELPEKTISLLVMQDIAYTLGSGTIACWRFYSSMETTMGSGQPRAKEALTGWKAATGSFVPLSALLAPLNLEAISPCTN